MWKPHYRGNTTCSGVYIFCRALYEISTLRVMLNSNCIEILMLIHKMDKIKIKSLLLSFYLETLLIWLAAILGIAGTRESSLYRELWICAGIQDINGKVHSNTRKEKLSAYHVFQTRLLAYNIYWGKNSHGSLPRCWTLGWVMEEGSMWGWSGRALCTQGWHLFSKCGQHGWSGGFMEVGRGR